MQETQQCGISYQLDFNLVMMRHTLARANGIRPEDETAELHAQIVELSAKLELDTLEGMQMSKSIKQGSVQLGKAPSLAL